MAATSILVANASLVLALLGTLVVWEDDEGDPDKCNSSEEPQPLSTNDPGPLGCTYSNFSLDANPLPEKPCPTYPASSWCEWEVELSADFSPGCVITWCYRTSGQCASFVGTGGNGVLCGQHDSGLGSSGVSLSEIMTAKVCCKAESTDTDTGRVVGSLRFYDPSDPQGIGAMFANREVLVYCCHCE